MLLKLLLDPVVDKVGDAVGAAVGGEVGDGVGCTQSPHKSGHKLLNLIFVQNFWLEAVQKRFLLLILMKPVESSQATVGLGVGAHSPHALGHFFSKDELLQRDGILIAEEQNLFLPFKKKEPLVSSQL